MSQTGMLDRIASKGGIVSKIKFAAKALISKLTGNKLDIRAERVKALMKKLDAAAKSNYGSLAKTANVTENAQKSTESDESAEGERTVIEGEKGTESDTKMSVAGELDESLDDVIDLSLDTELATIVDGVYGSQKYKRIAQYILDVLGDEEIILSDGRKAIVDKSDAMHIANKAAPKKTAKIAKIKEIIQKARIYAQDTNAEHNKFNQFYYYEAKVKLGDETFPVYLNVGKAKNDGSYHIYDITKKIKDTADRINGLERPKPNEGYALKNGISDNSISQPSENVNGKFSLSPETDSEYLTAVENGDMEVAQRMVDEAANAAGYTIKAYHGTGEKFTRFDPDEMSPREGSFFFAENREDAAAYGSNVYEVYLTDRNLADYDNQPTEFYKLRNKREQVEWLKNRGYEGWYADMDSDGWGEYSVFSPSQVKSADPVTYDDNGNVIPLSERFNERNEDIRWSVSEESKIGASNSSPYDYDTLIRKSDMTLTVVDDTTVLSRSDIKTEAIKNAASIGYTNENGNAVVHVDDVDSDIIVPKKSIAHGLDRRTDAQSAVFVKIGEVLKNSVKVNELLPRAENIKNSYVLVGAAVGKNGTPYIVSFIVNKHSNEISEIDVLYSANTKKESAAFLPKIADNTATPTNSKISIAQLLNFVNNNFPDILPESVLRHFGHTERPKGTIGESALYSLSEEIETESEASYEQLKRQLEKQKQKNKELAGELIRTHGKKLDPKAGKANLKDIIERYQGTVKPADVERKFQRAFEYEQ